METGDDTQPIKTVGCLMLSHPAKSALASANIRTIDELCQVTAIELRDRWQVSSTGVAQIRARLAEIGLRLNGD
jgi:hypothetical protein